MSSTEIHVCSLRMCMYIYIHIHTDMLTVLVLSIFGHLHDMTARRIVIAIVIAITLPSCNFS